MAIFPNPSAYQRFVESVFGADPEWLETVDVDTLLALPRDERRLAEKLLIERIEADDWRAPAALAAAVTRGAVMPMKRRMPLAGGRMRVAMALALADLEAIPTPVPLLAGVLRADEAEAGLAAVSALALRAVGETCVATARDALMWAAVNHSGADVRAAAGAALIHLNGLAPDPLAWEFRASWQRLRDEDARVRKQALERILGLSGGGIAGGSSVRG